MIKSKVVKNYETSNLKYPNLKIGLVIPAYNEEKNIENVLSKIPKNISNELKIIIIDDGSTDKTLEIIENYKVIVLKHNKNKGNGAATITGLNYCRQNRFEIVIILDADGQHDPNYLDKFIAPLVNGTYDFVIGNRFATDYKMKFSKKLCSLILTIFYFIIFRKKISDPTNGYRALSQNVLSNLIFESHYSITQEMLYKVIPHYKFKEIPIKLKQRENGKSFIKLNTYLFKMAIIFTKFYIIPKLKNFNKKLQFVTRKRLGSQI